MKTIFISIALLFVSSYVFGQKESLDLVSYLPVNNWKKQRTAEYVSFTTTDEKKGTFCSITLYAPIQGETDSKANFDHAWKTILEPLGAEAPKMETPGIENGWQLQTGTAAFSASGLSGSAMLITATSQDRTVNLVALLNSDVYASVLNDFIASIELKKVSAGTSTIKNPVNNSSLVGVWADNLLETSGYMNNMPQYTAGYFRKEYTFRADGTYQFRLKTWSVYMKNIMFCYETGSWSVSGNQLTLIPKNGKNEEWSKAASNRTTEWGKRLKSGNRKLVKTTYTFSTQYYSGSQSRELQLFHNGPTERELSLGNNGTNKVSYSAKDSPLIDLPPGLSISSIQPVSPVSESIASLVAEQATARGFITYQYRSAERKQYYSTVGKKGYEILAG